MGSLTNIRHEQFCRIMLTAAAKGLSQARAYQLAGYDVDDNTARMAASRLMTRDSIRMRLDELRRPKEQKVKADAASLIEKSEVVYTRAVEKDQLAAARGAIELQGKLSGALVDRVEIGEPGAFAGLTRPEEIVSAVLADNEDAAGWPETLRWMADEIERQLGDRARVVGSEG
ncbi:MULTISPECIES: hypothetical protein [unclassified Bradyrhizobium]|uniref:hypothetical protein n=1 Tax=unclassified Bradyrhizobium TaxID=2631580 RepID=UPI0029170BE5|nr:MULTISPECIES: hypothetical protein [unclassified Bradyrhizobium]